MTWTGERPLNVFTLLGVNIHTPLCVVTKGQSGCCLWGCRRGPGKQGRLLHCGCAARQWVPGKGESASHKNRGSGKTESRYIGRPETSPWNPHSGELNRKLRSTGSRPQTSTCQCSIWSISKVPFKWFIFITFKLLCPEVNTIFKVSVEMWYDLGATKAQGYSGIPCFQELLGEIIAHKERLDHEGRHTVERSGRKLAGKNIIVLTRLLYWVLTGCRMLCYIWSHSVPQQISWGGCCYYLPFVGKESEA